MHNSPEVTVVPSIDPAAMVRATANLYSDVGYAPGSPGEKNGHGISGFGGRSGRDSWSGSTIRS